MKSVRWIFLTVLASLTVSGFAYAQEFSADVVYANASSPSDKAVPKPQGKIFVSKHKMHLESRGMMNMAMLVDADTHKTYAIYPTQKAYSKLGSPPPQYFWAGDPENACSDWQQAIGHEIKCEKVGPDTVDGRSAVKYKSVGAEGSAPDYVWIDTKLKFVIKWDEERAIAELHNVKEGPQDAKLFEIPAGYDVLQPKSKPARAPKHGK